jgi:hypothetical protein
MKKLITAAMALALFAGMASAQVNSDNIVGYVTITNAPGDTYSSYGNCFITAGDNNTNATLACITAGGMTPGDDYIQFLNPADTSVDLIATYIDAAAAAGLGDAGLQGWWNLDIDTRLDGTSLPAGTGFLCNIASGNQVVFTFTGEVVEDIIELDLTGQTYPMVANTVPAELTLGDISANGMVPGDDYIQFLNPLDTSVDLIATYIDAAAAAGLGDAGLQGWWNLDIDTRLDSTILPAGWAFLCNLASGNPVMIAFPNPVAP